MGEPAEVSPADRAATRDLARRIVESVREDEEMPWPNDLKEAWRAYEVTSLTHLWQAYVFQLAQEISRSTSARSWLSRRRRTRRAATAARLAALIRSARR